MYKIGKTYAGLKILAIIKRGSGRTGRLYVEHVIDCGERFEIGYGGIYMRVRNGIVDTCMKCTQRKRYKLPKPIMKVETLIDTIDVSEDIINKYMIPRASNRRNM